MNDRQVQDLGSLFPAWLLAFRVFFFFFFFGVRPSHLPTYDSFLFPVFEVVIDK